jgi:hypothetical protein
MPTLDFPSVPVVTGVVDPGGRRYTYSATIFSCEPKYRILRAVTAVSSIHAFRLRGLRAKMQAQWCAVRTHSSWSRA